MAYEYAASSSISSEQLRTPNEEDIDNELLIDEIQQRELLYDKSHPDFVNLLKKSWAWEEVGERVFHEAWHDLTEDQKSEACKSLQRRWKNIRACFSRELREQRKQSGPSAKKGRRKYLHFDRLQFLVHCMEDPSESAHQESAHPSLVSIHEQAHPSPCLESAHPSLVSIHEQARPSPCLESAQRAVECVLETLPEQRRRKPTKAQRDDTLVDRREEMCNEIDQEKNFALSLIPLLKRIPKEKRLATEIKILQVIQSATE